MSTNFSDDVARDVLSIKAILNALNTNDFTEDSLNGAHIALSALATAAARVPGLEAECNEWRKQAESNRAGWTEALSERDAARRDVESLRERVATLERERAVDVEMLSERGRAIDALKTRAEAAERRVRELEREKDALNNRLADAYQEHVLTPAPACLPTPGVCVRCTQGLHGLCDDTRDPEDPRRCRCAVRGHAAPAGLLEAVGPLAEDIRQHEDVHSIPDHLPMPLHVPAHRARALLDAYDAAKGGEANPSTPSNGSEHREPVTLGKGPFTLVPEVASRAVKEAHRLVSRVVPTPTPKGPALAPGFEWSLSPPSTVQAASNHASKAPEVVWHGDGVRVLTDGTAEWLHGSLWESVDSGWAKEIARALAEAKREEQVTREMALEYVRAATLRDDDGNAVILGPGKVHAVVQILRSYQGREEKDVTQTLFRLLGERRVLPGECARKAAEDMRERAAQAVFAPGWKTRTESDLANLIRSLPLEDKT